MTMDGRMHFAVRSLQSPSGLEGAFRVHISPEHLDQVGLRVGDVCEISGGEDGTNVFGYGIAWRAADKMGANPKQKPAKMTDTLRMAFNIKEGSHVNLRKSTVRVVRADKVVISDISPLEYSKGHEGEIEDERWWTRCLYALMCCEAFTSGITFEVSAKKGLRKRFYIDSVESKEVQHGAPHLFFSNDHTTVVLQNGEENQSPSTNQPGIDSAMTDVLTSTDIGGLATQIQELNRRMKSVLQNTSPVTTSKATLIHGYEGTGKSHILKRMERSGFRKVIRLDLSELETATTTRNKSLIVSKFDEALASQPSLILIDDLEQFAPASGEMYGRSLVQGLDKLPGSRVLVIAACRNPSDVYQKLIKVHYFNRLIELPIPDLDARRQILAIMLTTKDDPDGTLAQNLSLRTHGFTGQDLAWLDLTAREQAEYRHEEEQEQQQAHVLEPLTPNGISNNAQLDGSAHSQAASRIEQNSLPAIPLPQPTLADFNHALTLIRPTALREIIFEKPQTSWSDIGGSTSIRSNFDKKIRWPQEHSAQMQRLRMQKTKGILLYGPPGCSKTLTAQAVATSYDLNFIAVKGAELISMYVGESERAVREIFRKARAAAPCVIFFDEIDSIASARESAGGTKGLNVLTTLLNEMDGFEALNSVLVLAATNKPDILDPAIMRPGRFDAHLYLGLPDQQARKEILNIQIGGGICREDVDLEIYAGELMEGFTGAEIVGVCQVAKERALERAIEEGGPGLAFIEEEDLRVAVGGAKKGVTGEMLALFEAFGDKG